LPKAISVMILSLDKFNFQKFGKIILQDISWNIQESEHWVVLGGTGSGKSTILELVKQKATAKCLLVAKDYAHNRLLNQAIQYYQQRFNSYDSEIAPSVREFLTDQIKPVGTINDASVVMPPPSVSDEILNQKAQILKINHLLERKITSLSNGETRRTLLTKALCSQPDALLMDMPFVGLDVESRQILHQTIDQVAASGTTVVLATVANEIPASITHILVLENGKIQFIGTKEDWQKTDNSSQESSPRVAQSLLSDCHPDFAWAVSMRDVNVKYGEKQVLKNINWEVRAGEKWALLGPNGSGKSTLLSLVTADNPQSYANDFDLFDRKRGTGESIWDIKKRIGFVSPELHLYSPRVSTVFKAVASGLFDATGLYQKLSESQTQQVNQTIELLGLQNIANKTLLELSTGQQRMTLLARALVKNPALLILDEPCQGLDDKGIMFFKELVEQLCQNSDRTLIYVTHYAAEIPNCVTKVFKMNDGVGQVMIDSI
jgi:molybdate transport system ATP-binding protein